MKTTAAGLPIASRVRGVKIVESGPHRGMALAPGAFFWSYPDGASKAHLVMVGVRLAICGVAVGALTVPHVLTRPQTPVCRRCAALCSARPARAGTR